MYRFDVIRTDVSLLQLRKDITYMGTTRRLRNSNKWKGTGYEKIERMTPIPAEKNLYCAPSSGRQPYTVEGCGIKKEKTSDSELLEIVIGIDYFEPWQLSDFVDGEYKGIDGNLQRKPFRGCYQPEFEKIVWGRQRNPVRWNNRLSVEPLFYE